MTARRSPPPEPGPGSVATATRSLAVTRVERWLRTSPPQDQARVFSAGELAAAGEGRGRAPLLAALFAGKLACCALLPEEAALGRVLPGDFDLTAAAGAGRPRPVGVARPARAVLDRRWIDRVEVALEPAAERAAATAAARRRPLPRTLLGAALYWLLPIRRRVVMENLERAFGDVLGRAERRRIAQACYRHFLRFGLETILLALSSPARRARLVRVENLAAALDAYDPARGLFFLSGHFGNWEVATVAGIGRLPEYRGVVHVVRKVLRPAWLNTLVTRRFTRAGIRTLSREGALDAIQDLLADGRVILFVFDQFARGNAGVWVDFLRHRSSTPKGLAILAHSTGAPVVPVGTWREEDGTHVLRFEDPVPLAECVDAGEAIRRSTRRFNAAIEEILLRHPEQWIWMHRRWKR